MCNNSMSETLEIVESLRAREKPALAGLATRCYERMIRLARPMVHRLGLRPEAGAEDAANRVLEQVAEAAAAGTMPPFESSERFWGFVKRLTWESLLNERTASCSLKRGGAGRHESRGARRPARQAGGGFHRVNVEADDLPCAQAGADEVVLGADEVDHFIGSLGDQSLMQVVRMRQDGYTLREIAEATGRDVGTVKRKLRRVCALWKVWARRR